MTRYSFAILHSGREVENLDPGTFATEAEASAAAEDALDLCCPPGSGNRRHYRVEVRPVRAKPAKHTPGPWELGPDIRSRGDLVYRMVLAGKKRLCAVSVYGGRAGTNQPTFSEEEVVANGHLIAAAPDLLAACEALVNIEGHQRGRCSYCGDHVSKHGPRCPLHLARAAIAKAKGKA